MDEIDELAMLRDLLPDEPPGQHAVAAARRTVLAVARGGRPARRTAPAGRTRRTALALTGAAAVAAAGVTAGVLVAAPTGGPAASGAGPAVSGAGSTGSGPVALSAHQLLLTAATTAERAPATGGNWRLVTRSGRQATTTGGYVVDHRYDEQLWVPRAGTDPTWRIVADLGAAPATPADAAAWRRAGSPRRFTIPPRRLTAEEQRLRAEKLAIERRLNPRLRPDLGPEVETTTGAAPYAAREDGRGSVGYLAGHPRTLAELAALPTDPAQLAAWLRRQLAGAQPTPVTGQDVYQEGLHLVMHLPVSPAVRAAAFRMLADLPGVRVIGQVRDPLGRPGQAVGMLERQGQRAGQGQLEDRLVLDASGVPLATETVVAQPYPADPTMSRAGQLTTYEAVLATGWTTDRPVLPARRLGPDDAAG